MRTYEDNKNRSQKNEIAQWKKYKRKIDEENLQWYGLVKEAAKKLMNQIVNFDELECEKSLNIISEFYLKVKENLIIWSK